MRPSWWITSRKEAVTSGREWASPVSSRENAFLCLARGPSNTSRHRCPASVSEKTEPMSRVCFGGGGYVLEQDTITRSQAVEQSPVEAPVP